MCLGQLLVSRIHINFNLRNNITQKNCNPLRNPHCKHDQKHDCLNMEMNHGPTCCECTPHTWSLHEWWNMHFDYTPHEPANSDRNFSLNIIPCSKNTSGGIAMWNSSAQWSNDHACRCLKFEVLTLGTHILEINGHHMWVANVET